MSIFLPSAHFPRRQWGFPQLQYRVITHVEKVDFPTYGGLPFMELNEAWIVTNQPDDARASDLWPASPETNANGRQPTGHEICIDPARTENSSILNHYARAGSLPGRILLQIRLMWTWLTWVGRINGGSALKRGFDISTSLTLLLLLSPLFLLIALLVKLEDRGPVFFAQTRVGRFGLTFKMFKIRSMCLDAEARWAALVSQNQHVEGITFKIKHDPRITKVGRWLRKFSLDELPQLYNVLIGDMSLVGPRPPLPREVQRYTLADHRRLAASPGITCFWQVSGRSEIDFSGQVKLDVDYIEQQSFWTDARILLKTVPAVLAGKGAC
jgi:lipopolysaccharide/colanic/teichoic acid biosynthesis glycosyltransferase